MKIFIISVAVILILFFILQIYISVSTAKSETQDYKVIRVEKEFEIRYYPVVMMAKIFSKSKSYGDLGSSGFRNLAKYIFGGNRDKMQIPMTSPVHMEIGDSLSSMAFVMPSKFNMDDLPQPNNTEVVLQAAAPEYVAVLGFGGFASAANIEKNKALLEKYLKKKGIKYHGNFRFLGYNPPYQLFGRRNEVIVAISDMDLE
jgi:hypothetical protein